MKKKELFSKPNKLTKKDKKKLKKQFPKIDERIENKLEIIAILFWLIVLVGSLYILYLMWTYKW